MSKHSVNLEMEDKSSEQALLVRVSRSEKAIKTARMKKNLKNKSWLFWMGFKYFTLLLAALFVLVPPYSVLMTSFKTLNEYYTGNKIGDCDHHYSENNLYL